MEQYSSLASCYDALNSHIDYQAWSEKIASRLEAFGVLPPALVLDLACGTGNFTIPLSEKGYDMIGIDLSPDMLNIAREKSKNNVLWLLQDMKSFELYGTVGAVICCLDSINYITGRIGLRKCLSLVHNYLDPDGIFIFDMNSEYKFKSVYADNHYVLESDGVYCGWKNHFDDQSGICEFELSLFVKDGDTYRRYEELQRERYWPVKTMRNLLEACGFEIIEIASDLDGSPVTKTSERIFFIARAKK